MELFDYLTDEDKIILKEFIESYADIDNVDLEKVLQFWNRDKKKMFKVLGRKLRVKIPIDVESDYKLFINKLYETYQPPFGYAVDNQVNHPFITDFEQFWSNKIDHLEYWNKTKSEEGVRELFKYDNIKNGYLNRDYNFHNVREDKSLTLSQGAKIMKSIQKMLKFVEYPNMDLFEKWRNDISNITTSKHIKANLVFSIHPLDFLTMSDNTCGWRSCMSWMNNGGYSTGPIEMMNSNMVIIAYLESNKDFIFNNHKIPNKTWRTLLYVHKDILLEGKCYPFYSKDVSTIVLDKLRELVYNNMKWKYQYINQTYTDMKPYHSNGYVRNKKDFRNSQHKIIVYTNGMYNDVVKDGSWDYICCRNWVPKTLRLCASGVCNCMCCGEPIMTQEEIDNCQCDDDLVIYGSDKVCGECQRGKWCSCCQKYSDKSKKEIRYWHYHSENYQVVLLKKICETCLKEYFYDAENDLYIHTDSLLKYKEYNPDYKIRRAA